MKRFAASGLLAALVMIAGVGHADAKAETRAAFDARGVIATMEGSARGLQDLLSKTRLTQDKRATACVNDSLSQANALTRRARERFLLLRDAGQRGDQATEALLLAQIKEDRALERQAGNAAYACVGVMAVPRGHDLVTVKVTIDKNIPPEQPDKS
jgi:hypothetical protein